MISLKFIPLTFITSNDEIIRQIKNTVVFAHLFENCEETTLKNYIETTQYGFTASALESGSHRLLRITDIHHSKVDWENVPFCDCSEDEKYLLEPNDILVARTGGTTGKSFFVENPPSNAIFASYLIRIRLKEKVNIEFIKAFLNSYCFWSQIVEMKGGSAQPNVNAEKLKVLKMPKCDLETQEKTVRLLNDENNSEFENVRERINFVESLFWNNNQITTELSHQLELVSQLRQAFLREAMQGKLVPQDTADEPAEILLEKIKAEKEKLIAEKKIKKQKPLPEIKPEEIPFEIPNNWTWCRLGEITDYLNGYAFKSSWFKSEGIRLVRNVNVGHGNLNWQEVAKLPEKLAAEFEEYFLSEDDIVLSLDRPIISTGLKIAQIKSVDLPCLLLQRVLKVIPIHIYSKFLFVWFSSEYFIKSINPGRSIGIPHVSHNEIIKIVFPLPPLAEQKRIVEKLEKLMKFCDELETNIRESSTRAETLLQVALKEALEPK